MVVNGNNNSFTFVNYEITKAKEEVDLALEMVVEYENKNNELAKRVKDLGKKVKHAQKMTEEANESYEEYRMLYHLAAGLLNQEQKKELQRLKGIYYNPKQGSW